MGQQIAAVLARDFGPLLQRFAEFVEKHTPEIIAAVDRISQKFIAWLQGVDWSKVEDGINKLIDGLKWVVTHLDTIKDVAEGIAAVFAVKWGIGIVASIAQVVAALGTVARAGLRLPPLRQRTLSGAARCRYAYSRRLRLPPPTAQNRHSMREAKKSSAVSSATSGSMSANGCKRKAASSSGSRYRVGLAARVVRPGGLGHCGAAR